MVSLVERGHLDGVTVHTLRAILAALEARLDLDVRWRGGALDRLVDERHATLVNLVVSILGFLGWETAVEVSFSQYGERGSIDVLAWHPRLATLLVVEVKTEITSAEETLRRVDIKTRLGRQIAADVRGWRPARIATILVLPESTASRSAIRRFEAIFKTAFPARGREIREWLREPAGVLRGAWFLSPTTRSSDKCRPGTPSRVRLAARGLNAPRSAVPVVGDGRKDTETATASRGGASVPHTSTPAGRR